MTDRSHAHDMALASVCLYGKYGDLSKRWFRRNYLARKHHIKSCTFITPPYTENHEGWYRIMPEHRPGTFMVEGVILKESGQGVIITSRDCHVVTITNRDNGWVCALHAGRQSHLGNLEKPGVIDKAMHELEVSDGRDIEAYVTGGICAKHFEHNDNKFTRPFLDRFGDDVITDPKRGTLDLLKVIQITLSNWGVPRNQIAHDNLCTYEENWLGSRRASSAGQNWTVVVKK